jgi:hypothetical protein
VHEVVVPHGECFAASLADKGSTDSMSLPVLQQIVPPRERLAADVTVMLLLSSVASRVAHKVLLPAECLATSSARIRPLARVQLAVLNQVLFSPINTVELMS